MQTPFKRIPIATSLFLIMLALLGFLLTRPGEPTYQGKTLTEWLHETETYPRTASEQDAQNKALMAVKEIGTNAIPQLLDWLIAKDTHLGSNWNYVVTRRARTYSWRIQTADEKIENAASGFKVLGLDAQSATPALLPLTTNSDANLANRSFDALLRVNAEVESYRKLLPLFLHSPNPYIRERSARELVLIPIPEKEKEEAFQVLADVEKSGQSAIPQKPMFVD